MVLVCANERDRLSGRNSCGHAAGGALRKWLRDRARIEGIKGEVLVSTVRCLGICPDRGTTIAALPDPTSGRERRVWVVETEDDWPAAWQQVKACLLGGDA